MDYRATTFGMDTRCTPVSRKCGLSQSYSCPSQGCFGGDSEIPSMSYDCDGVQKGDLVTNGDVGFFIKFLNSTSFGKLQKFHDVNTSQIHFVTGALVVSSDGIVQDPEAVAYGAGNSTGILFACTSSGYDLTFDFINGSVSRGTYQPANKTIITNLQKGIGDGRASSAVQSYFDNAMLVSAQEGDSAQGMADYFAASFSEIAIGLSAAIMEPLPTLLEQTRNNVLVARLPKAPFFTLMALNLLYATLGVAVTIWAFMSRPRETRDVQARMSIPGLVAALIEPDGTPRKGKGIEGLFAERVARMPEKRVAIRQIDESRWAFEILTQSEAKNPESIATEVAESTDNALGRASEEAVQSAAERQPFMDVLGEGMSERIADSPQIQQFLSRNDNIPGPERAESASSRRSLGSAVSALTEDGRSEEYGSRALDAR